MIIVAATLALAQAAPKIDCRNTANQSEINICTFRSFQAADRALNAQWKRNVAKAKEWDKSVDDKRPSHYSVLVESQRAWLRYRGAQCTSEGYWARGGTMEAMLVNACMERLTRQRIKELQDLAKGLEG